MDERIIEIIQNFDFVRVHLVMKSLDWKWFTLNPRSFEVPSISQLKEEAVRLLKQAAKQNVTVETGGFRAENVGEELKLSFVLEYWETEKENYDDEWN